MATVSKPILLDETGKDLASAIREQTQTLAEAIINNAGNGGGVDLSDYATKAELENKQDILISGETIKTISGQSVLGSGDIELPIANEFEAGLMSAEDKNTLNRLALLVNADEVSY